MNGTAVAQPAVAPNPAVRLATDINSYRIGIVAEKLAMSAQKDDPQKFFHLCLSLASEIDSIADDYKLRQNATNRDFRGGDSMLHFQRGIDYGVANNEPPTQASKLTPVLKQVCCRKKEFYLQSAIMVLMISVKNACKLGWFSANESEELLALADEVGNYFCTRGEINNETSVVTPTLSSVMSRYYPQYKLGHIITSFEVKPGYGTYLMDFHITKDLLIPKDERIRLLVAMKDNVETSSCIISPQQVNILLNGRPVEKRTNVQMDPGPQAPTVVNQWLKYGTNLLQAVGQFNGHYILVIAAMSTLQTSDLPAPQNYVPPDTIVSAPDSEIIEGASRISLNCPISYRRIKTPAKGHLCKHYQCFDLSNYVEINSKRPSWRCPHCNQSVAFPDLRVDRMMVKVLEEAEENVSEVTIQADGSWKVASNSGKDDPHDKTTNKQDGHEAEESSVKSDTPCNVFDLTGEDYEMDTSDGQDFADKKPVVHHNIQNHSVFPSSILPSIPRSANEVFQHPFSQATNGLSSGSLMSGPGAANYNMSSEALLDGGISGALLGDNFGIAPVLTDAVSPSLNRQLNNFQETNYPLSSIGLSQLSPSNSLQLQEVFYGRGIPRNVSRVPNAIQALPVQMPSPNVQQHVRHIMSLPATNGSSAPFQMPLASSQHVASTVGSSVERQRHFQQSHMSPLHVPSMNRGASQAIGTSPPGYNSSWRPQTLSQPPHLMRSSPQTLSQPPHLMRSSQLPRGYPQQGVAAGIGGHNSTSTVQRVNLTSQQAPQMRQHLTLPPQTQLARVPSSLPSNPGFMPQAVSRTENLIDIQQAEQNWRPTGRMRGALTGQAYSAALNQHMPGTTPAQTPSARPSATTPDNLQVLLANRMISHATQSHNRFSSDAVAGTENAGTQADGSGGIN